MAGIQNRNTNGNLSGMKRWLMVGLGIAVVAGAGWWWMHGGKKADAAGGGAKKMVTAVEVVTAVQQELAETLQVAGQVQANAGVELRSEVTGRVVAINFKDGAEVKKGSLVVVLDDSVQRATLAQAEANYALAEANVGRYQRLVGMGAASQLQVDQADAEMKLQKANIQMAKANLAKYRIVAPFDGVAGIAQVSVGDIIQPGERLVALTDNATLKVTFKVPEAQATSLKAGAPVQVRADGVPGANSPTLVEGHIAALDGRVDPPSRTLEGKVLLDNPDHVIVAGQFVRVRVPVRAVSEAIVVPDSALVPQGNKILAYVIVPGQNGAMMASRTTVEVGLRNADKAQIVSGVNAGQQVVTAGQQNLQGPLVPVRLMSQTQVMHAPQAVEELR